MSTHGIFVHALAPIRPHRYSPQPVVMSFRAGDVNPLISRGSRADLKSADAQEPVDSRPLLCTNAAHEDAI
jgi:hypothetical protein